MGENKMTSVRSHGIIVFKLSKTCKRQVTELNEQFGCKDLPNWQEHGIPELSMKLTNDFEKINSKILTNIHIPKRIRKNVNIPHFFRAKFFVRLIILMVLATGREDNPYEVNSGGSERATADAEEESDDDAENVPTTITEGAEGVGGLGIGGHG
ncbi:hypothetical protein GOBAR_AA33198 [Gossypium barbadense]|uniref:Uncharacterized protein n=1 Tax=Gossypium barbadense TaxID=3634 RepID=A0A2P5W8T6_GOSBA|nr:hypothetical protein GOBAR_AA33198 [Gossypium barbadense]